MATIGRKLLSKSDRLPPRPSVPVPTLTFSEDREAPFLSGYDPFDPESRWTDIYRGPVLRIISPSMELLMKYKNKKEIPEYDDDVEGLLEPPDKNNPDSEYTCEATEPFVANTPQCKQTRLVVLKNEGTTTIRYQWLRFPPSKAMRTMLANPRHFLNLDTPGNCNEQDKSASASDSSSTLISGLSDDTYTNEERRNAEFEKVKDIIGRKPNFLREASFDFHFREMPGILLPGQTIEMPIVYHPRQAGYCHENLYLLTHPRVSDESDKTYMVRLTGFCMDSDWASAQAQPDDQAVTGNEMQDPESVKRTMNKTMLELLSADLIDSVLDHALYKKINQSICTLPTGKVTPECIFHTHNPHLHYHYGVAERAIETAQKLNNILVPGYIAKMETRNLCPLSIKNLYYMLWDKSEDNEFVSFLRTTRTEKLLRKLAKYNKILSRPPIFAYANAGSREHTGCQVYLTAVFDEILERMDIIKETFEESPMYKIQRGKLEDKYRQKLLREHYRTQRRNERTKEREQATAEFETGQNAPDPPVEEKRVSFTEDGKAEPPTGAKTIEDEKEISENIVADTDVHTAETEIKPEISPMEHDYDESGKEVDTDVEEVDIEASRAEKRKRKKSKDEKSAVSEKVLEGGAKKNSAKKTKELKKKKGDKSEKQDKEKQKSETLKEHKSGKGSMEERKLLLLEIPGEMDYDYPEEIPKTSFTLDKTSAEEIFESVELEVGEMLRKRTETKLKQARLIAFENMIGVGIERMMSIVDTMKNVYDYKSPDYFGQNPPRE